MGDFTEVFANAAEREKKRADTAEAELKVYREFMSKMATALLGVRDHLKVLANNLETIAASLHDHLAIFETNGQER